MVDWPEVQTRGPAWPLLAATFLVGIGIVSLLDSLAPDGDTDEGPLFVPGQAMGAVVRMVTPGAEHRIAELMEIARPVLHRPWEPLPPEPQPYWVLLHHARLPRLPAGWSIASDISEDDWRWVEVAPGEQAGRPAARYDLMDHMESAEVFFLEDSGVAIPCDRWEFGRWTCGLESWLWVGVSEQSFRGRTRRCIWAHPRNNSALVIRFPQVPAGGRLFGHYGITDAGVEMSDGAPVHMRVRIGEVEIERTAANRPGMRSYTVTPDAGEAQVVDIEYRITTPFDGRRHFCFTGQMQSLSEAAGETPSPDRSVPDARTRVGRHRLSPEGIDQLAPTRRGGAAGGSPKCVVPIPKWVVPGSPPRPGDSV